MSGVSLRKPVSNGQSLAPGMRARKYETVGIPNRACEPTDPTPKSCQTDFGRALNSDLIQASDSLCSARPRPPELACVKSPFLDERLATTFLAGAPQNG